MNKNLFALGVVLIAASLVIRFASPTVELWILIVLGGNTVIGAGVWAALDTDEEHWAKWVDQQHPLLRCLVVTCWPAAVYFWLRYRNHPDSIWMRSKISAEKK